MSFGHWKKFRLCKIRDKPSGSQETVNKGDRVEGVTSSWIGSDLGAEHHLRTKVYREVTDTNEHMGKDWGQRESSDQTPSSFTRNSAPFSVTSAGEPGLPTPQGELEATPSLLFMSLSLTFVTLILQFVLCLFSVCTFSHP